ncbi:MAG: nucleotidyltransferase domain-containing protein [Bacteroidales bacterium]|jgi:predicted nucleotidyltransferase
MFTQQTAINTVQSFAKEVKNSGLHLKKVILFGSYAKNKQHQYSDIDVAMVADEFVGIGFNDIQLFVNTLTNYIYIQPKTYPTAYFKAGDPFIAEIKKYGIEIKI